MHRQQSPARALAGAASVLILVAAVGIAQELPEPGGTHSLGTATYYLVDAARRPPAGDARGRDLVVQAWYPTASEEGPRASYIEEWEVLETLVDEEFLGQSEVTMRGWASLVTASIENAPPRRIADRFPLLLISPGLGVPRAFYTSLAQELASRGFVVVAVDHPFGSVSRTADGRILRLSQDEGFEEDPETNQRYEGQWADDLRFVASWATGGGGPLADVVDSARVGALGHSLGGAAAFEACHRDERFSACASLDGFSFGAAAREGVGRPALFLKAAPIYSDDDLAARGRTRAEWDAMASEVLPEIRAPLSRSAGQPSYWVSVAGTGHLSFSDAAFLMPDTISRFGGRIRDALGTHRVVSGILRLFFEEQLLGRGSLEEGIGAYSEDPWKVELEVVRAEG